MGMEPVQPASGLPTRQPSPPSFINIARVTNIDPQARTVNGRARPSTLGRTLKKAAANPSQSRVVIPQTLSVNIPSPVVFTKQGIEDLSQSSPNPLGVVKPVQKLMPSVEPTIESEALADRASAARTTCRSATPSAALPHAQEPPIVRATSARVGSRHVRGASSQSIQRLAVNTWTLSLPDFDDATANSSRPSSVASEKRPAPVYRQTSYGRQGAHFPPAPPAPIKKSGSSQGLLAKNARAGLLSNAKRMTEREEGEEPGSLSAPISPPGSPPKRPGGESTSPKSRREMSTGSACSNETGVKRGVRFGEFQLANYDPDVALASDGALTERTPSHSRQSSSGSASGAATARPSLGAMAPRPDKSISFRSSNRGVGGMTFMELAGMFEKPASDDEAADEDIMIMAHPGERTSDMTLGEILEKTSAHSAHTPGLGGVSLAERVSAARKEKEKEMKEEAEEVPLTPVIQARSQYMSEYLHVQGNESTGRTVARPLGIPAGSRPERGRSVGGPPSSPLLPWFEEASQKYNIPLERRSSLYNQIASGEVDGWEQPPSCCTSSQNEGWTDNEANDYGDDPFSGLRRSSDQLFQAAEEESFDHATEILKKKQASLYNPKNWSKNGGAYSKLYLQNQDSIHEKKDDGTSAEKKEETEKPKLAAKGEFFSFERLLEIDAQETKQKILAQNKKEEEKIVASKTSKKKRPSSASISRKDLSSTVINGPEDVEIVRTVFQRKEEINDRLPGKEATSMDSDGMVEMKSVTEVFRKEEEEELPICQSMVPLKDVMVPPPTIKEVLMENEKPCSTPRSLAPELNDLVTDMGLRSSAISSYRRSTMSEDLAGTFDCVDGTVLVAKSGTLESQAPVQTIDASRRGSSQPNLKLGDGKAPDSGALSARSSKACKNFQSVLETRPQTAATKIRPHTSRRTTATVK